MLLARERAGGNLGRNPRGPGGISFEKLFVPYLRGAKRIVLYDPYIRLTYQIYNFMSFCEILEPVSEMLSLKLVTGHDVRFESELKEKLEELKQGSEKRISNLNTALTRTFMTAGSM